MMTYPKEVSDAMVLAQDRFAWEAPSFDAPERGPGWFFAMMVVAVFFVAYAIWTANFLFAFIILLSAIILVLAGTQKPRRILVQVGNNGIVWDGHLFLFRDLDNFAIVYQPPIAKVLYIESRNPLTPRLRVPLEDQDPLELRDHLKQFLREDLDLQSEHISDTLGRLLGI